MTASTSWTCSRAFWAASTFFQSSKRRLRSGQEAVTFDFSRQLDKKEMKQLKEAGGYRKIDDAGRPFYNAAAGLTKEQENLLNYIEDNLTLRRNTASKRNKGAQVEKGAHDAQEKRLYGCGSQ